LKRVHKKLVQSGNFRGLVFGQGDIGALIIVLDPRDFLGGDLGMFLHGTVQI